MKNTNQKVLIPPFEQDGEQEMRIVHTNGFIQVRAADWTIIHEHEAATGDWAELSKIIMTTLWNMEENPRK